MAKTTQRKSATQSKPTMAWFDISGKDPERIKEFYSEIFGWKIEDLDDDYALIGGDEKSAAGGIGKSDSKAPYEGLVVYFKVDDVAATLAAAKTLGGKTLLEPTETPDGHIAVFEDLDGNPVGLTA